jgi:hypothetical protein
MEKWRHCGHGDIKRKTEAQVIFLILFTVFGQIGKAFHYRDRHVIVRLYQQYVRPRLELCTQA